MTQDQTRVLRTMDDVFNALVANKMVLHAPNGPTCELTFLHDDGVEATTSNLMYLALKRGIEKEEIFSKYFMLAPLQEPGCAAGWCIFSVDNHEAREWIVDPSVIKTDSPEEEDE